MDKYEEDNLTKENDDVLERIANLVKETNKMKEEVPKRKEMIHENFKLIRDKISNSTLYLTKIKQDIQNIKLTMEEDRRKAQDLTSNEYLQLCDKSDQEIDAEFEKIHNKLDDLQKRVSLSRSQLVNDSRTFQETLHDTVTILDNASKGIFNNTTADDS